MSTFVQNTPISTLQNTPTFHFFFYKKTPPPISFPAYGSGNVVRYCINRAGEVYDYKYSQRRLCDVGPMHAHAVLFRRACSATDERSGDDNSATDNDDNNLARHDRHRSTLVTNVWRLSVSSVYFIKLPGRMFDHD